MILAFKGNSIHVRNTCPCVHARPLAQHNTRSAHTRIYITCTGLRPQRYTHSTVPAVVAERANPACLRKTQYATPRASPRSLAHPAHRLLHGSLAGPRPWQTHAARGFGIKHWFPVASPFPLGWPCVTQGSADCCSTFLFSDLSHGRFRLWIAEPAASVGFFSRWLCSL